MGKTTYYWNDDTQSLSYKGVDYVAGEVIPAVYQEEQEAKFDKFCENQQISSKKNITFSEKQKAQLVNARTTVDKLRIRIEEQTVKIKGLEKKCVDYEASFDDLDDLSTLKDEIKQLKAEKKYLGECFAALESESETFGDEKAASDLKIEELEKEKTAWEAVKTNKKELEKLLKAVK